MVGYDRISFCRKTVGSLALFKHPLGLERDPKAFSFLA